MGRNQIDENGNKIKNTGLWGAIPRITVNQRWSSESRRKAIKIKETYPTKYKSIGEVIDKAIEDLYYKDNVKNEGHG